MAIASADKDRLASLDLLRGLAAMAILARHFPWPGGEVLVLPRSYLGVDLFFTLSGFVIAYSYQDRLAAGMPVRRYLLARLVRLYPLYILGTLLGAAFVALQLLHGTGTGSFRSLSITLATAALFLPTPSDWSGFPRAFFPLDFLAWSLFFELFVNVVYGLLARRLSNRVLGVLIVAGAVLIGLAISQAGTVDVGAEWSNAHWAFGRALFSFFVGVALFRLRERVRLPALPAWLLGLVLVAALLPPKDWPWGYDLTCIAVLFPLLVWAAADASGGSRMRTASLWLGFLSYPVYVLQMPLIQALIPVCRRAFGIELADSIATGLLVHFACIVAISWLAAVCFDTPVRAWLKRRFALPPTKTSAQNAP